MDREIRYCTTEDGVRIAYCVEGDGAPTILALPAFNETFSLDHLMPVYQRFYRDLGAGRRVVRFDWRGTGLSASLPAGVPNEADQLRDMAAVARAAAERCVIWAPTVAGPAAIEFAVSHPDLVSHLIFYDTYAAVGDALSQTLLEGFVNLARGNWQMAAQTIADSNGRREFPDEAAQLGEWYYRSEPGGGEGWVARGEPRRGIDRHPLLAQIHVPTLVLHRIADPVIPLSAGQKLAAGIPGARFVPLEGKGHLFCLGDYGNIVSAVDTFLGDRKLQPASEAPAPASGTAIILFADIAGSTALTERLGDVAFRSHARTLDGALRKIITDNGGTPIEGKLLGDGVLATFPAASRAIAAALACAAACANTPLQLHLGIHAGDVLREENSVFGGAVNIASRISDLSAAGEVLVSNTVRDLARTSAGVAFDDRGEQTLKGIGDAVRVYAVRRSEEG